MNRWNILNFRKTVRAPLALLAAFVSLNAAPVFAASSDTISLMVTPMVTYGVKITSVNELGYDFGTVDLNTVTHSTAAIVVENNGNVASQWQLRGTDSQDWQLASSTAADQFSLLAVFTSTQSSAQVSTSEFTDSQDEVLTNYQTADGTTNAGKYNGGVNLNAIPPSGQINSKRNLWLKLKMPSSSNVATNQEFRLYITAVQTGQ